MTLLRGQDVTVPSPLLHTSRQQPPPAAAHGLYAPLAGGLMMLSFRKSNDGTACNQC
ncbi:hypothetical protein GDO81_004987 [Engystomops pustulosus]|uniref:Uncharacterized protein n=1 Tax=Engystomops pustulosus TaxID=76066 RepID=A0AAV7CJU4_ENGPU|nr:hypothetical protein GDO81_004987 [Engystomops pustulosus]